MKLDTFRYIKDWEYFFVLPTIVFTINERIYYEKNIRVSIHWLGWHFSWLFREKGAIK